MKEVLPDSFNFFASIKQRNGITLKMTERGIERLAGENRGTEGVCALYDKYEYAQCFCANRGYTT